ncbi:MAG: ATP-binding protein, partial [Pseudobdellovibrionaceae bacterium]|nr:ATP-binding protein [Pseudobdellovibrionaceae bacterium]
PFTLLFFQSEFFYREILRKTEERVHAERMADLGRIAAGTAHEVNNPLTIVHFVLQLLEQDELLRHRPDRIERIHKGFEAIERIRTIVQRLLSLTQSPMDAYESIQLVDFPEIISHLFGEHMRDDGIRFELEQKGIDDVVIFGQKGRILEILISLISNAVDAVRDKPEPQVHVSFFREADHFCVRVRDSGPGVTRDKVERIFAPFFTTKEIGKGTGLGLSSSRSIARHHGGDLLCHPGPGGEFLLRLPLLYKPADLVADAS